MSKVKRIAHFINPNKGEKRPHHAIFFDTETEAIPLDTGGEQLKLKLGWVCYWTQSKEKGQNSLEWCFFNSRAAFWSFVSEHFDKDKELYLIAHNIAFDFRIMGGFDHAKQERWRIEFLYHKGMTTLLMYETGQGTLKLLDMGNFFSTSLAEIGKVVGIEKTGIDFDGCSFQELSDYCRNDVQILVAAWETWLSFLDEHDLGDFRQTLAAQAMSAYRHNAMAYPIKIHNDAKVCELEREAYRGGRVECFMVGELPKGSYYQLDVNGMYCYMMSQHEYPRMLKAWPVTLDQKQLKATLKKHCVVTRVILHTDIPAFPFRAEAFNIYPIGTFQIVLTTPELEFALEHCEILKIGQVAIYERAPIFRAYAEYFAELKDFYWKEGNKPFREIAKKLANSLYGKFGQTDIETDLSFELPPIGPREAPYYDWRVKKWYRIYELGHQVVFEKSGGESFNSFPAIPAHVTAYARMYLWSLIEQAGVENTFYCATDSLIINQAGYDNLADRIDPYKLGYLKVETVADTLEIWGPNNFRLGDKLKSGGIRKTAIRLSRDVFEQDNFLGLRGAIRRGDPDLVTVNRIRKQMRRQIKTGIVGPGARVRPFQLRLPVP
ncbi:MAG: hypothetical protein E3J21_08605 [Anaerolineales bacterium]|nr:MAG: hypothetical protein E3J21_08605 [Anaerolineales bacterium]